ncbi:ribonuclease H [Myxococcus stipitatus DSM 14675]|uniref:Ribonuclease H n=1 Tax=Myxococcus stipitatus (strain DSM 14675 / JCM 12634 / Mx s8) TaxID=1278073 RepID=L7UBS0_MYXSD|nr:RNase H family protein [Myxococcus stipitatus]AGC43909.1 ribonuclease H [Myxococcus stipitatus DSM 14675]
MKSHATFVFADGACSGNPGPGGWGVIIATPDGQVVELGGHEPETTNNRMELTAVGKALRHLEATPGPLHIHTDSTYVIQGITRWAFGWSKRGWKTADGKEVANTAYWKRLMALLAQRKQVHTGEAAAVEWHYVRGHVGVPGNERVDAIAVSFSRGKGQRLYTGALSTYEVDIHDVPEDTSVPEESPKQREAKAKAHSYLSQVGRSVKRHATWAACERRVKGVSDARFKKTRSAEDEAQILDDWGVRPEDVQSED